MLAYSLDDVKLSRGIPAWYGLISLMVSLVVTRRGTPLAEAPSGSGFFSKEVS